MTTTAIDLKGTLVTQILQPGLLTALRLWKLDGPLTIVSKANGLTPVGDIGADVPAQLAGYGCRHGGTFLVTLLLKETPVQIDLFRNGRPYRTLKFASQGVWRGRIPAIPSPSGVCTLGVTPTGLTGSTVFTFQPG